MTQSNHKLSQNEISILMFAILVGIALILTLYVQMAIPVMYHVTEGVPEWTSGPAGAFFPLPKEPGMLMAITPMNIIDQFIYIFLLKTWLLVGITIAYWIGAFIYASLLIRKS